MGDSGEHVGVKRAFVDISQSAFAEEKRKLLDVIDKIRDIGGDLIPQLPRIVVIGVRPFLAFAHALVLIGSAESIRGQELSHRGDCQGRFLTTYSLPGD
jgi:hypothetical protein